MKEEILKNEQYKNSKNFDARILIHSKYGTNKTPWPIWLFHLYNFKNNAKIIEFGCGNGLIWKVNSFRINPHWNIILSDFSQGMIESAKQFIGPVAGITYQIIDLSEYRVNDVTYTNVIANHMLYHLHNREAAIEKIYRMLEIDGEFYCSTIGMENMKEMKQLIAEYTGNENYLQVLGDISNRFSLENGEEQISTYFKNVKKIEFEDALEITDSADLVNYVFSCNNLKPGIIVLPEEQREDFKKFIDKKMLETGKIHITKSSGTFIAKKE
ncbi:MAG: methyltransferase domain-containing protein [Spirochaetales bacterium]|nr:methyltransferase domain-containing protein [Spirochaetales bacterium]